MKDIQIMDPREIIARRVSLEIRPKMLVNLGIGIPTLVSDHLDESMGVLLKKPCSVQTSLFVCKTKKASST